MTGKPYGGREPRANCRRDPTPIPLACPHLHHGAREPHAPAPIEMTLEALTHLRIRRPRSELKRVNPLFVLIRSVIQTPLSRHLTCGPLSRL